MQQVNQNEQSFGEGMIIFADKEGRIQYASVQGYAFSYQASKEECFQCATMLNGGEEVTEEFEAAELLCLAIYETEREENEGKISHEEGVEGCAGFRCMIASLLDSPRWCAILVFNDKGDVIGVKFEKVTAEEFAVRYQNIDNYFDKLAA